MRCWWRKIDMNFKKLYTRMIKKLFEPKNWITGKKFNNEYKIPKYDNE